MNNVNYEKEMQDIIRKLKGKPTLLLHSCCAPCSSACIERIKDYFKLTVYFYNPNIDTDDEYNKRRDEQIRLCKLLGVDVISEEHDSIDYYRAVKGLEKEREGGLRCDECFYLRLKKTAQKCKELGFDFFATTLTVSPLKNSHKINEIGKVVENETEVKFLPSDFKKHDGYLRSITLSKEYGLYRQDYCGCVYSKNERKIKENET